MKLDRDLRDEARRPALDYTDERLFDLLHEYGLPEAPNDASFNREFVLGIARAAFWLGAGDAVNDKERMSEIQRDFRNRAEKATRAQTERDVPSVPES